jgi:hypothetical protein
MEQLRAGGRWFNQVSNRTVSTLSVGEDTTSS